MTYDIYCICKGTGLYSSCCPHIKKQIQSFAKSLFTYICRVSFTQGHERPRDKGVNSEASLQQHKPHLVQPGSESQESNKVDVSSEHVIVLVPHNATMQARRSYHSVI